MGLASLCDSCGMTIFRTAWALGVGLALAGQLRAELVTIGKMPAKVVPEQVAQLSFQSKGMVSDLVVDTSHRLAKGTVVGVMDKDKMSEAQEDMELQITRDRLTKRDEVRKLKLQRKKLSFYLNLSPAERKYAKDMLPEEEGDVSLEEIDERIALLQKELSTMERRKRAEFDSKHEQNTLRMPFDGRLQYHFPMPEDPSIPFEYAQGGLRPFASVCDDSAFYITLNINDTDLSLLPEDRFSAYINMPSGKQLRGTFAFRRVEKTNGGGDMLVYFFKLPVEDHETAYNMLGSNANAVLLYSAEEDVKTISKISLLAHPAAPECEDWKQLVAKAYPGHVIVVITERDVLIRQQKES